MSIANKVNKIVKADTELRGEAWLVLLGYAACNDYAQSVVNRLSSENGTFQYYRFETVARYVRSIKSKTRAKLDKQAKEASQIGPVAQ